MASNTKALTKDFNNMPAPQFYNPVADEYEVLQGADAATNVINRPDAISQAPVHGKKTITTVASALFAGSSALDRRYAMKVYNAGADNVYWGGDSSVTVSTGMPILPGCYEVFGFHPQVATPIYFVASNSQEVRVVEAR